MKDQAFKKTPAGKGVRTALQAIIGTALGLIAAVWAVPGVPEAVVEYLRSNALQVLLVVGVPSGLVAFVQNKLGK